MDQNEFAVPAGTGFNPAGSMPPFTPNAGMPPFNPMGGMQQVNPINALHQQAMNQGSSIPGAPMAGAPSASEANATSNVDLGIDATISKAIHDEVQKSMEQRKNFSRNAVVTAVKMTHINPRDKVVNPDGEFRAKDIDKTIASFISKFGIVETVDEAGNKTIAAPNKADTESLDNVINFYETLLNMKANPDQYLQKINFISAEAWAKKKPTIKGVTLKDETGKEAEYKIGDLGDTILSKAFGYVNVQVAGSAQFQVQQANNIDELNKVQGDSAKLKKLNKKKSYVIKIQGKENIYNEASGVMKLVNSVDTTKKAESSSGRFRSVISVAYKKIVDGQSKMFHFRIPLDAEEFEVVYSEPFYVPTPLGGGAREIPALSADDANFENTLIKNLVRITSADFKKGKTEVVNHLTSKKRDMEASASQAASTMLQGGDMTV